MKCCELTLPTPAENLACDEVLLDLSEERSLGALLRLWEPTHYFVVVGYANRVEIEVNREFCRRHDVPILRRFSGGGAVLQGPGCLNYTLVLPVASASELSGISGTNHYILRRHREALQALLRAPVDKQGHTDLTIGGLKFSGNAQRRRKDYLLFHGSFLLHVDIGLIEKALHLPSHQPEYRLNRSHADFLMNLKIPAPLLKAALIKAWGADETLDSIPLDEIALLGRRKYCQDAWNYKF